MSKEKIIINHFENLALKIIFKFRCIFLCQRDKMDIFNTKTHQRENQFQDYEYLMVGVIVSHQTLIMLLFNLVMQTVSVSQYLFTIQ